MINMSHAHDNEIRNRSSALNNGVRKTASHGELYGLTCKVAIKNASCTFSLFSMKLQKSASLSLTLTVTPTLTPKLTLNL